jgi:hypothetical protein
MSNRRTIRRKENRVVVPRNKEQKLELLASALSSPLDLRNEEQLSLDTGIPISTIRSLQVNPQFMEPVALQFHRNLEHMKVFVLKKVFQAVETGDMQAARLALKSLGIIGENDNPLSSSSSGAVSSSDSDLPKMNDEELEREIHRLLIATSPDDVVYDYGTLSPVGGFDDSSFGIDERDLPIPRGDSQVQEDQTGNTSEGEAEETL